MRFLTLSVFTNHKLYWFLFLIAIISSYTLMPTQSDLYKDLLSPYRWQSNNKYYIDAQFVGLTSKSPIKITRNSNIIYLNNNNYFRSSFLSIEISEFKDPISLSISESGKWKTNNNHLIYQDANIQEVYNKSYPNEIKQALNLLIRMDKELHLNNSVQIQKINNQTVILTGINSSSTTLFRMTY